MFAGEKIAGISARNQIEGTVVKITDVKMRRSPRVSVSRKKTTLAHAGVAFFQVQFFGVTNHAPT